MRNEGIRLNRYLSLCGIASRRGSEKYILDRRVVINGKVVDKIATIVYPEDIVELDGKRINILDKVYIVLNKPVNTVCSKKDFSNRKRIYDIVRTNVKNIFSIGRLDYKSSGLLILTNDGEFANSLMHPSNKIIKEYTVKIDSNDFIKLKSIFKRMSDSFKRGLNIDGVFYKAEDLKLVDKERVKVYLIEGKKREIRVVFKYFNININSLCRTKIGNMSLDDLFLKEGEYRFFTKENLLRLIYG